ncbi:MAG: DUF4870 domain-containing protein [Planctomycetaceae bacterium]|nr:DUF4870 domain-containing protein [Planctomycetaceae bacterium]
MSQTDSPSDDRLWAMLCHLATFVTLFGGANIIAPLVIWMVKKDTSPLVDDQGKEVLNFQITMMIGYALAVACILTVILLPLAILMLTVLPIWHLVLSIIGAIKAYDGQRYRYPLTLRVI